MSDKFKRLNELLGTARTLGLEPNEFRQAGPTRWEAVLVAILETFTISGAANLGRVWIWEDFTAGSRGWNRGATDVAALNVLGDADLPVFCLIERNGGHWVFEGTLGASLAVIGESPLAEFCIVPTSLDWLVCENHHDMWIAVGETAIKAINRLFIAPF